MAQVIVDTELGTAYREFNDWFVSDYVPAFVRAVGGASDPGFISRYWASPLWAGNDFGPVTLAETDDDVSRTFAAMASRLHDAGYADSIALDQRSVIFNRDGAAIDLLWSRRRSDGTEIERVAVHFGLARRTGGIRIVTFETHSTHAETLNEVWPLVAS